MGIRYHTRKTISYVNYMLLVCVCLALQQASRIIQ